MANKPARIIAFMALAHLSIELSNQFLPVVYPVLIRTLDLTYAQIGIIALVASTATTLTQPLFGHLSDRWSPMWQVVLSVAWVGLSMGLVGFTQNYWSLLIVVALGGLGSAAFHPPGATVAATYTQKRKGAAMSMFSLGGTLGTAFSPVLMAAGLAWFGLQGTWMITPLALVVAVFLAWQLRSVASPAQHAANRQAMAVPLQTSVMIGLALVILAIMARSWFQMSLMTYMPVWAEEQGQSVAYTAQLLFVFSIFVSVGTVLGGPMSDRVGRWQVMALTLGLVAPVYWVFLQLTGPLQLVTVGMIGLLVGSSLPVGLVMAQEAWPSNMGVASGLAMGLGWLPGGIGASTTGFLADQTSLLFSLQSLLVVPAIGAAFCLLFAWQQRHQSSVPQPSSSSLQ